MGYCIIPAMFYGNAELFSNELVVVCLSSFSTETVWFVNIPLADKKITTIIFCLKGAENAKVLKESSLSYIAG